MLPARLGNEGIFEMSDWTDKKIEKLKKLWEKGFSAAEIGKKLDFSKNAIVGKVHRLGLSNRNSPIKSASVKSAASVHTIAPKAGKKTEVSPARSIAGGGRPGPRPPLSGSSGESVKQPFRIVSKMKKPPVGVSMLELTSDMCCWPIDDVNSENFHFCGKKVFKNKPYCLEHCAIAYTNSSTPLEEKEADEEVFVPEE
jgi:GcrA cell cycle regulator